MWKTASSMFRRCIVRASSCRNRCPPALPKAHRFSWRAGNGKGSFPAVSVGSSYTSPLLLYRCADNQSREKLLPTCLFTFALPKLLTITIHTAGQASTACPSTFFCPDFESVFLVCQSPQTMASFMFFLIYANYSTLSFGAGDRTVG